MSERVRLTYRGIYSFSGRTGFLRNRGILDYVSKCRCWGIGLTVSHERQQGFSGGFQIRLVGLGDESRNLFEGGIGAGAEF